MFRKLNLQEVELMIEMGRRGSILFLDEDEEWRIKYSHHGNFTVAALLINTGDICVGCAKCFPSDKYDKQIGRNIAFSRACRARFRDLKERE